MIANHGLNRKKKANMLTDERMRDLRVGAFYWVWLATDPEGLEWENQPMPARYAGDGRWHFLNQEGDSDWPLRWVGAEILEP